VQEEDWVIATGGRRKKFTVFGFWGGREEEKGAGKMEGAGGTTRMGSRSSTRHGPASVFQGKVRRWRKSWTQVASPSPSASGSRILLYKWVPLAPPANANGISFVSPELKPQLCWLGLMATFKWL